MPQQNKPLIINDFSSGVIMGVHPDKMPAGAVPFAVNFCFDEEIGAAKLRKGSAMVGSQISDGNNILGLANFRSRSTTNHALLAVATTIIYKGESWTSSLTGNTTGLKTRFCQFLDSIVRINGTDGAQSFNGSSWVSSSGVFDLSNFPTGVKYVINYKDRVCAIGDNGVLYASSLPRFYLSYDGQTADFNVGAKLTGGTSGAVATIYKDTDAGTTGTLQLTGPNGVAFQNDETITDDSGGSATANGTGAWQISWTDGYVTLPIDPDNGQKGKCTGMGVIGGLLFIFFERAFYTWNGSATTADPISSLGCSSNESITNGEKEMLFANENGWYVTQGGFPQKISHFIQPFFDAIPSANYADFAGGCDGKFAYLSVGDVTYQGITVNNAVLRFTLQTQEMTIYSYPTRPMVFAKYIDGTDVKLVFGDNDGNVIEIDSTDTQDNYASSSAAIDAEIHTQQDIYPFETGIKSLQEKIGVVSEASSGAKLYYRQDYHNNRHEDWKHLGEIKEDNQEIALTNIDYKKIQFKVGLVSTKGRFILRKIEAPQRLINTV